MVMETHDLLKIRYKTGVFMTSDIPEWVTTSLQEAPFVVVRRAPFINGKVPIGVRGKQRNQRFGTYMSPGAIINHIPYTSIIQGKEWITKVQKNRMPAFQALSSVYDLFQSLKLPWGPGGSVGFELVSGISVVNDSSDLDIVISAEKPLSIDKAKDILNKVNHLSITVDVQVKTPNGGISLREYARGENSILLKTKDGPQLVKNPWDGNL